MLIISLLLPSHPIVRGPRRKAGCRESSQNAGQASALLPGSPGVRWDQAMIHRGISPPQPAPRQGRRQRSLPASLPPSQAMERKLGQASSLLLLTGGRGRGAALQFPPDQHSLGRRQGWGSMGSPIPTHTPDGVSEPEGPFSSFP